MALCLTDSGEVQEAPSFGLPVFALRDETESVPKPCVQAPSKWSAPMKTMLSAPLSGSRHVRERYERMRDAKNPYGDGRASRQ